MIINIIKTWGLLAWLLLLSVTSSIVYMNVLDIRTNRTMSPDQKLIMVSLQNRVTLLESKQNITDKRVADIDEHGTRRAQRFFVDDDRTIKQNRIKQ